VPEKIKKNNFGLLRDPETKKAITLEAPMYREHAPATQASQNYEKHGKTVDKNTLKIGGSPSRSL
jgi:hypothetical protein